MEYSTKMVGNQYNKSYHHPTLSIKVRKLYLDDDTTAIKYVNECIIRSKKTEDRGEGAMATTKIDKFLEKITDEEYNVVVQSSQMISIKTCNIYCTAIRMR